MIEVRTYEGDAQTVSNFTRQTWLERYKLDIPVIDWSPAYFEKQLLWDRPGKRDFLVAAYDGARLIGTLFAEEIPFQHRGEPVSATMGSWLTVDPDYRGQGIARMLAEEQRRRHRAANAKFMLGFGVLGTDGPKFWGTQPDTRVLGTVGFWARLFDHRAVAEWSMSTRDRVLSRVLGPLRSGVPRPTSTDGIREWTTGDLAASRALLARFEKVPLGYRWTDHRMTHHLAPDGASSTLVFERDGAVVGLLNYYVIAMTARTTMPIAVIDFIAIDDLTAAEQRRFLDTALAMMAERGATLAMALRLKCWPSTPLWRAGFVPLPPETSYLCTVTDPTFDTRDVTSLFVHWR